MKAVAITDFKARCLALLEDVARTGEPLVITKRGKALARVVPSYGSEARYPQQALAGTVTILGDVIEPVMPPQAWTALGDEALVPARSKARRRRR